jgi:hypothetical protein
MKTCVLFFLFEKRKFLDQLSHICSRQWPLAYSLQTIVRKFGRDLASFRKEKIQNSG